MLVSNWGQGEKGALTLFFVCIALGVARLIFLPTLRCDLATRCVIASSLVVILGIAITLLWKAISAIVSLWFFLLVFSLLIICLVDTSLSSLCVELQRKAIAPSLLLFPHLLSHIISVVTSAN